MMNIRSTAAVLLAVLLMGGTGLLHPTCGQGAAEQDTTAQTKTAGPTPHGRWGIGGQLLPVVGPSLRVALTRRITVQMGGTPFPGEEHSKVNYQGIAGGRVLYKVFVGGWYSAFVSGAANAVFVEAIANDEGGRRSFREAPRESKVEWFGIIAAGVEVVPWSRLGISAEAGVTESWSGSDFRVRRVVGGVGLHYYW